MKRESDTTDYELKVKHIILYVPIAQLYQNIASEINSILTTGEKSKPVGITIEALKLALFLHRRHPYSSSQG